MAVRQVLVNCGTKEVWSVLSDGRSYGQWVVGTTDIRAVDEHWPEVGSSLYYTVGRGRLRLEDSTTVRVLEPDRRIEFEAHAWPYGTARVAIQTIPWTEKTTVVILDEHPLRGPGARLHSNVVEFLLHLRSRRMLTNLAQVAEQRSANGRRPAG